MSAPKPKTYKIGQVAQITGLKSFVLRFWESEFPQLEPLRTPGGQRLYDENQLALLTRIKVLLYEEGLTIEGARKRLADEAEPEFRAAPSAPSRAPGSMPGQASLVAPGTTPASSPASPAARREFLLDLQDELLRLRSLLKRS